MRISRIGAAKIKAGRMATVFPVAWRVCSAAAVVLALGAAPVSAAPPDGAAADVASLAIAPGIYSNARYGESTGFWFGYEVRSPEEREIAADGSAVIAIALCDRRICETRQLPAHREGAVWRITLPPQGMTPARAATFRAQDTSVVMQVDGSDDTRLLSRRDTPLALRIGDDEVVEVAAPDIAAGVYGNVTYIEEAGDLFGYEIRIPHTGLHSVVEVTFCEGVCNRVERVYLQRRGTNFQFLLPIGQNPPAALMQITPTRGGLLLHDVNSDDAEDAMLRPLRREFGLALAREAMKQVAASRR